MPGGAPRSSIPGVGALAGNPTEDSTPPASAESRWTVVRRERVSGLPTCAAVLRPILMIRRLEIAPVGTERRSAPGRPPARTGASTPADARVGAKHPLGDPLWGKGLLRPGFHLIHRLWWGCFAPTRASPGVGAAVGLRRRPSEGSSGALSIAVYSGDGSGGHGAPGYTRLWSGP